MPSDGLGKVLPIWSTIPLLRGEPPAPSVGTSPRALFPRTCCGSQIETALGPAAGGGRWAGRRAVPEPSAAAPPPGRASAAQPGDAAEARRIPAGQRCPPQRRGPGRRLRRLPAPRHRPRPPEAFPGVAAPGLPPRCPSCLGFLTPPLGSRAHGRGQHPRPQHGGVPVPRRLPVRGGAGVPPGLRGCPGEVQRYEIPVMGCVAGQGRWEPFSLSQIRATPAWAQVNSSRNQPWGPSGALDEILYPRTELGGRGFGDALRVGGGMEGGGGLFPRSTLRFLFLCRSS